MPRHAGLARMVVGGNIRRRQLELGMIQEQLAFDAKLDLILMERTHGYTIRKSRGTALRRHHVSAKECYVKWAGVFRQAGNRAAMRTCRCQHRFFLHAPYACC